MVAGEKPFSRCQSASAGGACIPQIARTLFHRTLSLLLVALAIEFTACSKTESTTESIPVAVLEPGQAIKFSYRGGGRSYSVDWRNGNSRMVVLCTDVRFHDAQGRVMMFRNAQGQLVAFEKRLQWSTGQEVQGKIFRTFEQPARKKQVNIITFAGIPKEGAPDRVVLGEAGFQCHVTSPEELSSHFRALLK